MTDILTLQREVHQNSVDHGFWEASADIPTKIALIHSELSEALEDYRDGKMEVYFVETLAEGVNLKIAAGDHARYYGGGRELSLSEAIADRKPEGFPVELADVVIRCMDLAGHLGIDLGAVVELKMAYNAGRPHLHGRKI